MSSIWRIVLLCMAFSAPPAISQTTDSEPPVVKLDGVNEAAKGDAQTFTVTVTDNQAVDSVVFFYRFESSDGYVSGDMSRIGQTDQFAFTIPADNIALTVNAIEYYVEVKDEAGNRTLQGFFFDPLRRTLVEKLAATSSENQSTSLLGSLSTTQKVLYGALGVVVVGALISAASDDGDDGDSSPTLVPVTITTETLD